MMKFIALVAAFALVLSGTLPAFAGNSETVQVTVTIASAADITVLSGVPVNFGVMNVNDEKVSGVPVVIKNSGSGINQTYSLQLTGATGWTPVITEPGVDQYRLSAAFDADGNGITWAPANHALTATSVAASATKFAGDETGTGVAYGIESYLYLRMETPERTDKINQSDTVTVTATVD